MLITNTVMIIARRDRRQRQRDQLLPGFGGERRVVWHVDRDDVVAAQRRIDAEVQRLVQRQRLERLADEVAAVPPRYSPGGAAGSTPGVAKLVVISRPL